MCAARACVRCAPLLCVQAQISLHVSTILGEFELFLFTVKFLAALEEVEHSS